MPLDSGAVTRLVRAAVRTQGLGGPPGEFNVTTIMPDTDLEALGVDSIIVGDLHARLLEATKLPIDPKVYADLKTANEIATMLSTLHAATQGTEGAASPSTASPDGLQQLEAATESYRATLWAKGIDGLSDRLYKDFWG